MVFDSFEDKHKQYINSHMTRRKGERLRRLKEGHGYAEKLFLQNVWWPIIGHYEYLHPEYEISDFKDGSRYLDFAYIRPPFRLTWKLTAINRMSKMLTVGDLQIT